MTGDDRQAGASRLGPGWIAAIAGVVLLGLALRIAGFSLFDLRYADEFMQYLEQANRLATGQGIRPWEWRLGLRNALIPQALAGPFALGHALAPGTLLGLELARAAFLALACLALPAAWALGAQSGRAHALVALFVVAVWWESVLYANLILSESLAVTLLLLAAGPVLADRPSRKALVLAGLLAGLGVLVRFQYGLFAAVLVAGALRLDRARWTAFLTGAVLAALLGALSDLAVGLTPFGWIWTNLTMNVGQDRASQFGTAPPLEYVIQLGRHFWPLFPIVLAAAYGAGTRYRPLFWAATANVAAHSLIAHKEYRFIWVSVLAWLVLAAIGSVHAAERWRARRGEGLSPLVLALLIAGWATASAFAAKANGGVIAQRVGAAVPLLANRALADPQVCALAMAYEDRAHLVPALLVRPVPILLAPGSVVPLPADLAEGANALLLAKAPGDPRYVRQECAPFADGQVCLWRRPGPCAPAPRRTYQAMLEANGL
ncbi:hypothetical protein [Novosphingobium percolationis]|uniref:hypothetical protein n=1 Tax=Novosphingobium percolationis TaxID=2871811 RepID=UPI001CD6CE34|nr:hypothetical protein [Novosphingobium percolationis]